ncbi:glutamate--tRNA ligase [Streptomyces lunaelactis]|uniref:glutamate--tRNA ligase n=1 Tax=Streptomyces lunaelactis TaxID=1535768 RepID=UPI0015852A36|nr:glutamate--tRNA ligase [Streptomyces lunaelactis]NUK14007.1 glutamate--tRNA ligase [Streptomyces lunaelactis]
MSNALRVRFAPSPTGTFHVGGARSALYNWALARQQPGRFILRIEDTDTERNRPERVDGILSALAALGISDEDPAFEGPNFQSHNADAHRQAALDLLDAGRAYYCDCTREELTTRTGSQHLGYDGFCRDRGLRYEPGRALRFHTPDDGVTVIDDVVRGRGRTEFPNNAIEDFVIARGNGTPVFILANAVDDIRERITHVIRGEEHLSNAPKQQMLWQALDAEPPVWGHLPVIVNEKRQKLSKRRDKVALEDYFAEGYLPEAMVNYLMLLGWGPGDNIEIRPYEELEARFRLEDVTKSSAFFDVKKLAAFNGEYLRNLSEEDFITACRPWLEAPHAPWSVGDFDEAVFRAVAGLAHTRLTVLGEITKYVDWLFLAQAPYDEASWAKAMKPGADAILRSARNRWADAEWTADALKAALEETAAEHGLKLGKAQAPVRVAVTGRTVGLPLFESVEVLGRERTLARIDAAIVELAEGSE